MTNIPSDEEFERASRLMQQKFNHLDQVVASVKKVFMDVCSMHEFFILPQIDVDFRAYVFFEKDADITKCERDGTIQKIEEFVYSEIERAGKGRHGEISVAFEYDSHERVESKFEGDYFLRLR